MLLINIVKRNKVSYIITSLLIVYLLSFSTAQAGDNITRPGSSLPVKKNQPFVPASGLNFDGVNDFINCGNNAGISNLGVSGFTLETWVNLPNTTNISSVIRKTGDYNLYVVNGNLHIEVWPNGVGNSTWKAIRGATFIPSNTWVHLAATWDGTTATFYINGVVNPVAAQTNGSVGGTENLFIGTSSIFTGQEMNGSIDELRIWNRALCQVEIQHNMNCSLDPAGQTGLVALYHFDQGTIGDDNTGINLATDASGQGNNGTLNNFALTGSFSNWVAGTVSSTCSLFTPVAGGPQVCQSATVSAPGTTYYVASCLPITYIVPSGALPVSGSISTCVKIDASVQLVNGRPYLQRHYDITPAVNTSTATATITLYLLQSDFDAYNLARGSEPALPVGNSDASGIANLRITHFQGTGTAPGNYTPGTAVVINPDDAAVVWNNTANWWEVTFNITGSGGFYIYGSGNNIPLPVRLISFSGSRYKQVSQLKWKSDLEINSIEFVIERSTNGNSFDSIASIATISSSGSHYAFTDVFEYPEAVFYRLKMVDRDDQFSYSKIIKLVSAGEKPATIFPNPVTNTFTLHLADTKLLHTQAILIDATGKIMQTITINSLYQTIETGNLKPGIYFLQLANKKTIQLTRL